MVDMSITKKIQMCELEIMKTIHDICMKNNLRYFLAGGSVLGAVRHNGFIPWDDDLDIMMFREDYNKFLEICKTELPDDLYLQYPLNEKKCVVMFSKIRMKNTLFNQGTVETLDYPKGFFVDVFPVDYVKKNNVFFRMKVKWVNFFKKIYFYQKRTDWNELSILKKCFKVFSFLFPHTFIYKLTDKIVCRKKEAKYCMNYYSNYKWTKQFRDVNVIGNGVLHTFENYNFYIPENFDLYLRQIYGDYMVLPPKEKRGIQHNVKDISFSFDDSEYFK